MTDSEPPLKAVIVPVTPFQQNCTLLWDDTSKRAVVIDPGGDLPQIERARDTQQAIATFFLPGSVADEAGTATGSAERTRSPRTVA